MRRGWRIRGWPGGRGARDRAARRRLAAAALVALAAASAAADLRHPGRGRETVAVAARGLAAGHRVTADDVAARGIPPEEVPEAALAGPAAAVGRTLAGPVTAGEVLTEARFTGTRLAELLTGRGDAAIVAVTPGDPGLLPALAVGDAVDVLAAGAGAAATPVARGARVVRVDPEGAVLLAAEPAAAAAVAAAGLAAPLTLVFAGAAPPPG